MEEAFGFRAGNCGSGEVDVAFAGGKAGGGDDCEGAPDVLGGGRVGGATAGEGYVAAGCAKPLCGAPWCMGYAIGV